MGDKINDGGPAFPQVSTEHFGGNVTVNMQGGLTLRDYFAAQALAAIIGAQADAIHAAQTTNLPEIATAASYTYADAMLAERERP